MPEGGAATGHAATHASIGSNGGTQQLWKVNDERAQKKGEHKSVFWVKAKARGPFEKFDKMNPTNYEHGSVYQGQWLDDKKHGYGVQVWANGNKYEGDWAYNKRDGHGVLWVKQDGKLKKVYAGNWRDGRKDGLGVQFYDDGSRYEGEWVAGRREGKGTLFFKNGDVYVGDWKDDKKSGFGTFTLVNNDVYEGQWLNDRKEGSGLYYYKADGKLYEGEWVNDVAKCGTYMDSATFFNDEQGSEELSEKAVDFLNKNRVRPLPSIGLEDAKGVLAEAVQQIHQQRQATREAGLGTPHDLFSAEDVDQLQAFFDKIANGEDTISVSTLQALLEQIGLPVSQQQAQQVLRDLGASRDTVDFRDFVRVTFIIRGQTVEPASPVASP